MTQPELREMLHDPHYLAHAIDPAANQVTVLPTSAERLARPSFIDGRSDFSVGPSLTFPLDQVVAEASGGPAPPGPDKMIFHVSFCGSTLLARMLEVPGCAFVLKEPNALVDLADWKRHEPGDARLAPTLAWLRGSLRRRWNDAEPIVVKPSNWANNLVPELTADREAIRPLFVTMARRPFLVAVLRGGRDRLAFTARAAAHLAATPQEQGWLRAAIAASDDPLARAVHLAAVTLHVQMLAFAASKPRGTVIDAAALTGAPVEAALMANRVLDLGIDPHRLAAHAAAKIGEDAKNPGRSFTASDRLGEDGAVERHHGAILNLVLGWAEQTLGPHPRLA